MTPPATAQKAERLARWAPATFLLAALLPEYAAPFLTLIGFICVLKARIAAHARPRFGALGATILIYLGWMTVGLLYSPAKLSALVSIGIWLLMLGGYYFFTETVDSAARVQTVIACGSLCGGVAGAIGIGQMFLFHFAPPPLNTAFNPFWKFLNRLAEKAVHILPQFVTSRMAAKTFYSFNTRACSTMTNPLFFAAIALILLPFAAHLFLCAPARRTRVFGLVCFLLCGGGVASSYSRGPYLYTAAVCAVLLLYGGKRVLKLVGVGAAAACGAAVIAGGTVKRLLTLLTNGDTDVSILTRKQLWRSVADLIRHKPFFGHGTGFDTVRQQLHNVYHVPQPHAHNIFLQAWAENGVIGALLLAAIFVVFFVQAIRLLRRGGVCREFAVTLLASVTAFLLCGMTDCLFYGLKPLQYLMMVLGLAQAVFALKLPAGNREGDA